MKPLLLSSEHPAGQGVCLVLVCRCRYEWQQGHHADFLSRTPVHRTLPDASKPHIIRLHFK
jgi:hypothetical protein